MLTCTGSSCQHAVSPGCDCGCGGGNHGARARLAWAAALSVSASQRTAAQNKQFGIADAQRRRARTKVKKQAGTHRSSRKTPRRDDATAFFDFSRSIDIVDWLVANPSELEAIEAMAQQVGDICEQTLTQHPGTHSRFADHFWCDVLAALTHVLTEVLDEIDKFPSCVSRLAVDLLGERTWAAVHAQRVGSNGNAPCQQNKTRKTVSRADNDVAAGLYDAILKKAVKDLVTALMSGVSAATHGPLDPIISRLRILAILFCPDPYAHKAVWDYCVVPLVKQASVIRSQHGLQQFYDMFKQQWTWPT